MAVTWPFWGSSAVVAGGARTGGHAVDVSNYSGPLTPAALAAWRDQHDVGLVIVQAVSPPPSYPPSQTRAQLEACAAAGIATDVYVYLWTTSNVEADIGAELALLDGLEHLVGRVWLDCEDVTTAAPSMRLDAVRRGLAVTDAWCAAHGVPRTGIYSGRWWWEAYLGDPHEFTDRLLWVSQYDLVDDTTEFSEFGGFTSCAIKQYSGSATLAGVTGVDLDVLA